MVTEADQTQVFLINGLSPTASKWAAGHLKPSQKALFVGANSNTAPWPNLARPIKLSGVLEVLDGLVRPTVNPAQALPLEATLAPSALSSPRVVSAVSTTAEKSARSSTARARGGVRQGAGSRGGNSQFEASNFLGISKAKSAEITEPNLDRILVVDDSDIALKFMHSRLPRYGFQTELVSSGEAALERIASNQFKFVFLDVMMEGLDGYQTCRAIKQRKYPNSRAPIVVMLTSRGGSIDKIRGSLAGCDAYLTKPLKEDELLKVLSAHDEQVARGFKQTQVGMSSLSSQHSTHSK